MKGIHHHIERVRTKPHHVRHKVALGAAGVITGFIAVVWLGVSLATGAFAIQGSGFAQATGQETAVASHGSPTPDNTSQVAGAAAAVPTRSGADQQVQIISEPSASAANPPPASGSGSSTIVPF